MNSLQLPTRDDAALTNYLTHIFLYTETLNTLAFAKIRTNAPSNFSLQALLLEARLGFNKRQDSWPAGDELLSLLAEVGSVPDRPDPTIIDTLTAFMLRPATPTSDETEQWLLDRPARLPAVELPYSVDEELSLYVLRDNVSFSTKPLPLGLEPTHRYRKGSDLYWDQPFDSISLAQNFLMDRLGATEVEGANHLIQRWIRKTFDLRYTEDEKYNLSTVCKNINRLFYGQPSPSREDINVTRTPTIGLRLFIDYIMVGREVTSPKESRRDRLRFALGVLFFMRSCRALRSRYHWFADTPSGGSDKDEQAIRAADHRHCITAMRALEYSYFLARVFGTLSDIPGLTFIFRGGLVPRTGSGRCMVVAGPAGVGKTVFALQKLAGVAARGGVALYFSLEETFELIGDRLVAFGLIDNARFTLAKLSELPRLVTEIDPSKGVLLLCGSSGKGDELEIMSTLDLIETSLAKSGLPRWRALAIDSMNAIDWRASADTASEHSRRRALFALVEEFERRNYLAVLLAEASSFVALNLAYLADTVIEMGFTESKRLRWFEITKCRSQNFQPGRHVCRLAESGGLRIYPSLDSVQSALRSRAKSTLSTQRTIWMPGVPDLKISDKSSVLIHGVQGSGKTPFALELASAPTINSENGAVSGPSTSVLVVNFRTNERRFVQNLQSNHALYGWWTSSLKYARVRWYSPGENLAPEQIVDDVWKYIKESRRQGVPLERIIFDELEVAEHSLPLLHEQPLFWSTILQLIGAEAVTAFFVVGEGDPMGEGNRKTQAFEQLRYEVDFIITCGNSGGFYVTKTPWLSFATQG
jgi:KaiC/GvpD/RAD55 family RecA-like ATPase